jgi:lipopolysaccharide transport system ATP-binding protein
MSNDNEILVKVDGVSKKFCRDLKKSLWYGVKDVASELLPFGRKESGVRSQDSDENREATSSNSKFKIQNSKFPSPSLRDGEFWAVKDVSFELRRGECIGLIGHNGAGKTTLLKMLNGLIKPDEGTIEMRGRVGALIALGAGFNPILTGRENIYVNGSILGLTKEEIDAKINDIIDFAEIHEFIDSPVQSYSSGMQVRLGFAVATAMNPDILILDEVLAVGDAAFRAKCFKRIGTIASKSAIIFVSHDQSQINRICDKALLLEKGNSLFLGSVNETMQYYNTKSSNATSVATIQCDERILSFTGISCIKTEYACGEPLSLEFSTESKEGLKVGIAIVNLIDNNGVTAAQADYTQFISEIPEGNKRLKLDLIRIDLAEGNYTINMAIFGEDRRSTIIHAVNCGKVSIKGPPNMWCSYKIPVKKLTIISV